MKYTNYRFNQFLKHPSSEVWGVLFFGPDRGLIREQINKLIDSWDIPIEDPFSISVISESVLKTDEVRFSDEMQAISLTTSNRLVRIVEAGDLTANLVKSYSHSFLKDKTSDSSVLKQSPDTKLIIEAGELPPRSLLRRFFETEPCLIAYGCYHDDRKALMELINQELKQKGYSLTPSAQSVLLPCLEGDRKQARSELEKLILYVGDRKKITHEDVLAICSISAEIDLQNFLFHVTGSQRAHTEKELEMLIRSKTPSISIIRSLQTHLSRLLKTARGLKNGQNGEVLIKALKPPVFVFYRAIFLTQARQWRVESLQNALKACVLAEIEIKRSGLDVVILRRLILSLSLKT